MIERVQLLMSVKNLSSAQLAEAIGVQRSGISHILSGRNKPSLDFVVKVLEAYPNLSESWLLRGEGEMLKSSIVSNSLFSATEPKLATEAPSSEEDEVIESVLNMPMQVNDEDTPYYGIGNPEKEIDIPKGSVSKPNLVDKEMLDEEIVKDIPIHTTQGIGVEKPELGKKLVKLIAVYSDDSFKVYHSE